MITKTADNRRSNVGIVNKILVIKLRAIGDVLISTSVLPNLKNKFPNAEIHFLTEPQSGVLLKYNPFIDKLIIFGLIVGLIFLGFKVYFNLPFQDFSYLINYFFFQFGKLELIFSAILLSSIFLAIYLLTQGKGIGFGDVKTAFLMGLFLKPGDGLLSILFASFYGSLYGLYLILKNKKFHQPIPFVPFLFLGVLTTIFFGQYLTKIYFNLFMI